MADFWEELNGSAPTAGGDMASQIADLYAKAGRPPPSAAEIAANSQNPGGLPAVAALLQADNAKAEAAASPPPTATGTMFGAPPPVYAPDAAASSILRQQYVAPQFTEAAPVFAAPTVSDVANDPFVQYGEARAIRAQQNSAAAKGTVLNAQTTAALGRDVQDYAGSQTNNVFNRATGTFQNNLATYGAKYQAFLGNAGLTDAADTKNKTAAQQTIANGKDAYATNFNANETSQTDYWNRLMDQARLGAQASAA